MNGILLFSFSVQCNFSFAAEMQLQCSLEEWKHKVQYLCSITIVPVQVQYNASTAQCNISAVPIQYQCSTNTEPIQYQCRTNAVPIQYQCSTNTVPIQYQCSTNAVPNTNAVSIEYQIPMQYQCSANAVSVH